MKANFRSDTAPMTLSLTSRHKNCPLALSSKLGGIPFFVPKCANEH